MKIERVVSGVVILENEDMEAILDAVDSIHRYSVFDVVRDLLNRACKGGMKLERELHDEVETLGGGK